MGGSKRQLPLKSVLSALLLLSLIAHLPEIRARSDKLFPYGLDERDAALPRDNDDISSPELRLTMPIVLYGQQFSSVYINQNGLISFQTEFPTFVNIQFPLEYPIIAPLYSDIDTRIVGSIYYRESKAADLLERARNLLAEHFSSAQSFTPASVLIVTWDSVGNFDRKSDKTNTFQVVIATDGRDSYAVFLYDKIEWIQGTGKNPSLPDAKAQAGIISGNGPFFSVRGSGTDQVSTLHKRSNLGEEGVWGFRIGNAAESIEEPDLNVGEDETSEASASCAIGATTCHSQSECVDYSPGFCCKCSRGYYGNGRVCLQDAIPQRVAGKVKGVLNGIAIEDADLFSYIIPADGRAYTAIAKIPDRLGFDLQTLSVIGTIIGWLFSISIKDVPNGFQLTGGVFNYTAEVVFQQTGQKASIHQVYSGLDVFSHLKVDTRIHGTTAIVPVGTTIEVNDYEMLMTRVSPGVIRSKSTHNYRVEGTSTDFPFTIEQTVLYEECPWASPVTPEQETTKMKVGRNYIVYDASQQIARYAITSKVTPPDGVDQCKENKEKCGPNSSCVATDDSFRCICNLGYEELYAQEGQNSDIPECVDIDECRIGTSTCDVTAICHNHEGSYSCECRQEDGYTGDGYTCSKMLSCTDVQCGNNAQCVEPAVGEPVCQCLSGFYGDGLFCIPVTGQEIVPGTTPDCRQVNVCDPSADCVFSPYSSSYICACRRGYTGDGIRCSAETETDREHAADCRQHNICHAFADCVFQPLISSYGCTCRRGYNGDGRACYRDQSGGSGSDREHPRDCREGNVCDPFADCIYSRQSNAFVCSCKPGFTGDGIRCMQEGGETCDIENNCDRHADCKFDEHLNEYACVCRQADGFVGNGLTCTRSGGPDSGQLNPEPTCTFGSFNEQCFCPAGFKYDDIRRQCLRDNQEATCENDRTICDDNAQCVSQGGSYSCVCNPGYSGDGRQCLPQDLCTSHSQCSQYGECSYNRTDLRYSCKCREGFEGDGIDCRAAADAGCDVLRNCDANGRCVWSAGSSKYMCECGPGYIGDGLRCQEDLTGCNVLNNCDRNAECSYDSQARGYRCHCKQGYEGDGSRCRSSVPCYQDRNVCDRNAECVPNQETREWKCQCNQGFNGDGYSCFEASRIDSTLLFVTKGMSIIKVPLSGEKPYPLTVDPFQTAIGIDFDCPNQKLYWSDVAGKFIKEAFINGTGKSTFLNADIGSPEGLSLDWASENLYWTDSLKDTIEVANLKTKKRKVLISTDLVNPRGIAVYPQRGRLYWSDWNRQGPKIEFSGLDGIGRQTLVAEGLALPNSLVIDALADQLCWADAGTHKIECVGVDGRSRRAFVSDVKYPFGLALSRDTFYWSDWETKGIESASRTGILGQTIEVPLGGPGKLYGVVLVPTTCPQVYSPCSNSPCSEEQICLPNIRGGRTCRCTDSASSACTESI